MTDHSNCSILPIGTVNCVTGSNRLFGNVFDGWIEGEGTYLLCQKTRAPWEPQKASYKAVITSASMEDSQQYYKVGDTIAFVHDQNFSYLGEYTIIGLYPNTKQGLLDMTARTGVNSFGFATFK